MMLETTLTHGKATAQRIVVMGQPGSGKSTLTSQLADILSVPRIELDALYWESGFVPASDYRERVKDSVTASESWIIDGNYRLLRPLLDPLVTHIIVLDLSFWLITWRIVRRTFWRWWNSELLWGKCTERLSTVFSSNGVLCHFLRHGWDKRKRFLGIAKDYQEQGKVVCILRSPEEVEEFLLRMIKERSM